MVLLFCLFLLPLGDLRANNPSTMAVSDLQRTLNERVTRNDFVGARPYLLEFISRYKDGSAQERAELADFYFFAGLSYIQEYGQTGKNALLEDAIKYLDIYITTYPNAQRIHLALKNKADAHRGLGQFDKAADDLERLLSPPLVNLQLPNAFRLEALENLVQSYYILREWDRGIPRFKQFIEVSPSREKRSAAGAALMEAYIDQGNTAELVKLLPVLTGESPARYNVSLNVSLLKAADAMVKQRKFNEAGLLLNLTLTLEQIEEFNERRLAALQQRLDNLRASGWRGTDLLNWYEVEIANTQAQLDGLKGVTNYTPDLIARKARNYFLTDRNWESFWAYKGLVDEYPNHALREDFMYAAFVEAFNIDRIDLATELGEEYLRTSQEKKYAQDISIRLAQFYLDKKDYDAFFALARSFVEEFYDSDASTAIIFLMGRTWLDLGKYRDLVKQFQIYKEQYPASPMMDGVYYWAGMAMLFEQKYAEARPNFTKVIADFPDSPYLEDAEYRLGITFFGDQSDPKNMEIAKQIFELFIKNYPTSNLVGEAQYFIGDIYASRGEMEKALDYYAQVEFNTDNHSYIQSAYFQAAKLLEKNKRYDEMVAMYERYLQRYAEVGNFTGVIYQLGRAQNLQGRPGDMLKVYLDAVIRYGDNPHNEGIDLILGDYSERFFENKERLDSTIELLQKAIEDEAYRARLINDKGFLYNEFAARPAIDREIYNRFRNDDAFGPPMLKNVSPLQALLDQYVAQKENFPTLTPIEQLLPLYRQALAQRRFTLAYRLQMTLNEMGERVDADRVWLPRDFARASPRTLIWMGNNALTNNPDNARRAFDRVLEEFGDTDFKLMALIGMGRLAEMDGNYEEAFKFFKQAEDEFPGSPHAYRAAMSQGDMLAALKQYDEAREVYQRILKTRDWRGEPYAEALFKIGMTYFNEGEFTRAHGFFERTFVQYAFFREWAAKAYLQDARTLIEMGEPQDAKRTLAEMFSNRAYNNTEAYNQARDLFSSI